MPLSYAGPESKPRNELVPRQQNEANPQPAEEQPPAASSEAHDSKPVVTSAYELLWMAEEDIPFGA
jgi:hypothetical protein